MDATILKPQRWMREIMLNHFKRKVMQQLSFIKFKTSIKAEDYLILREILQEDVEIAFVSDFYSVDFFNYLYRCGGGWGIIVAFNIDLADLEIESIKKSF